MREIVFDTETTGLSVAEGHRVVEVGMVELLNRMPTGRVFHKYINPEREMEAEVIRIHGITNERVANEPVFAAIADDMLAFIGDSPLVAHNASFDMTFLNYELSLLDKAPLTNEVIDTLDMARTQFPGARASLDALCARYEVDRSGRIFHGALLDANLLAEVYLHMTGGRQPGLALAVEGGEGSTVTYRQTQARPARTFAVPADELARHAAFVAKLDGGLWQLESSAPEA